MASSAKTDRGFEFYETPRAYTRYLFSELLHRSTPIMGRVFEPCVGSGAILRASHAWIADTRAPQIRDKFPDEWVTNDLDPRWKADFHKDARDPALWEAVGPIDFTISNTPFTPAIEIIENALQYSRVGAAFHLRASIHEVLKTGTRRTWMRRHLPTGILYLPRFAYQRSPKTGEWTTDSVTACWVVWLKGYEHFSGQFIDYAPEWVIDALDAETPAYRRRMDALSPVRGKLPHVEDAERGAVPAREGGERIRENP